MQEQIVGAVVGVSTIVGAFLMQIDTPMAKEITSYLTPFNTAIVTLLFWRVTQLEKTVSKIDTRMYNELRKARRRRGEPEEDNEEE